MLKYIIVLFLIIPISSYANTNTLGKYNILVLPVNIDTKISTKEKSLNQKALTELLQSYFVFSGMKVSSYKDGLKIIKTLKEKTPKEKNINYKDIFLHFKELKEINYILLSKLSKVRQYYIISAQLIDAKTKETVLIDKHKVFNHNNKPLLTFDRKSVAIQDSTLFLVNGIAKKIVNYLRQGNKVRNSKKNKGNLLQLMFVIDNNPLIKEKLVYIKNNLRNFIESVYKKHKKTKIEIAVITGKSSFPFTDNVIAVEEYIDTLVRNPETDYQNFKEKLYKGLINNEWSIYNRDHRMIFLLTDDPLKRQITFDEKHKLLVFPPIYQDIERHNGQDKKDVDQIRNAIYTEITNAVGTSNITGRDRVNQIISDVKNIGLKSYQNEWEQITAQLSVIHNINYVIDGTLRKEGNKYKLSIYLKDIKKNTTVHSTYVYSENLSGIIKDIDYIKYRIKHFYTNILSQEENKLIESIRQTDYSKLTDLAKSKSISVYTLAYEGINAELKNVLQRMAELMGGEYIGIKYNISTRLNNKKINFLYENETLYDLNGQNSLIASNISKSNVRETLMNKGYNIRNAELVFKGIFEAISNKIEGFSNKEEGKAHNFVLKTGNYLFPLTIIDLSGREITKINNIISGEKEVIVSSSIIPTLPYKIDYEKDNSLVKKLIKFTLSPYNVKIYIPQQDSNISTLLETNIDSINKTPYMFSEMGLIEKEKLWFLRGFLIEEKK